MAVAYLNEGATSLASANWSDSTGFADNATLVIRESFGNGSAVTAGLDESGLTTGIEYLDIRPGASGTIGGDSGPLKVDADASADAYIRNRGNVTLYIEAGGGSATINNYDCGGSSRNWLIGGTFTDFTTDGGVTNVGESAVITNLYAAGGSGVVEYNSTAITKAVIVSGTWVIRRRVNELIIGQNASVMYDPDPQVTSWSGDSISVNGGSLAMTRGDVPTLELFGGSLDLRRATEAMTPGGTSFVALGTRILEGSGLADLSNFGVPGALQRTTSGTAGGTQEAAL